MIFYYLVICYLRQVGNLWRISPDAEKNDVLPEFQAFLLEKKSIPERNVFFYALWVNQFFTFAHKKHMRSDSCQGNVVLAFIESLQVESNRTHLG